MTRAALALLCVLLLSGCGALCGAGSNFPGILGDCTSHHQQRAAKVPLSYRHLPAYRVTLHTRTDGTIIRTVHARSAEAARNIVTDGSWLAWVSDVKVEPVNQRPVPLLRTGLTKSYTMIQFQLASVP